MFCLYMNYIQVIVMKIGNDWSPCHFVILQANIRAKRREQFKQVNERPPEEISQSKFFDGRVE